MSIFSSNNRNNTTSYKQPKGSSKFEFIVAVSAFVLIFIVGECILRVFNDFNRVGPPKLTDPYNNKDNVYYYGRPWHKLEFKQLIRRNRNGYHASEFDKHRDGYLRIAVVGDSFVEALQVSLNNNFVILAEQLIENVYMLPLGKSGQYAPIQLNFFQNDIPELFGEKSQYSPIDAIIFCFRLRGIRDIALGTAKNYGAISKPSLPWRYKLKDLLISPLKKTFHEKVFFTESHFLSLLSFRVETFLTQELQKCLPVIDEKRSYWARDILISEVINPMISLAEKRNIRIGFLYIPSKIEISNSGDPLYNNKWGDLISEAFSSSNVPYIDARKYFKYDQSTFSQADGHPNEKGHYLLALALEELVLKIYPERKLLHPY